VEKVLGIGIGLLCALPALVPTRFGECVSDGGDEIGESCVRGGGVLPRNCRPLVGAGLAARGGGREGERGLDGCDELLIGGAIVSDCGSGVAAPSSRPSMEQKRWS